MRDGHRLFSKTPSGLFAKPGFSPFISIDDIKIDEKAIDFLLKLIIEGVRNYKGQLAYETHQLTWELKTGDTTLPITADFLKNEFFKQLRKVNIDAFIYVKNHANKFEIWVIFEKETPLEVDLQVTQIFCQLEKEYDNIDMSLFMASEKELDGHDITSF